jgi:hypothetical protein
MKNPDMIESKIVNLGFKELIEIESHVNTTIEKGELTKSLEKNKMCKFETDSKFVCNDLHLVGSRSEERMVYQLI